jgi:hypothetical protein
LGGGLKLTPPPLLYQKVICTECVVKSFEHITFR